LVIELSDLTVTLPGGHSADVVGTLLRSGCPSSHYLTVENDGDWEGVWSVVMEFSRGLSSVETWDWRAQSNFRRTVDRSGLNITDEAMRRALGDANEAANQNRFADGLQHAARAYEMAVHAAKEPFILDALGSMAHMKFMSAVVTILAGLQAGSSVERALQVGAGTDLDDWQRYLQCARNRCLRFDPGAVEGIDALIKDRTDHLKRLFGITRKENSVPRA
jgi:hypothetical protein